MNPNDMPRRRPGAPTAQPTNKPELAPETKPTTNEKARRTYGPYPVGTVRVSSGGKTPATLELSRRKGRRSTKRQFSLRVGDDVVSFSPPVAKTIAKTVFRLLKEARQ